MNLFWKEFISGQTNEGITLIWLRIRDFKICRGVLGQKGVRGCSAGQGTFFHLHHQSHVGSQKHQSRKISPWQGTFLGNFFGKIRKFWEILGILVPYRVSFFAQNESHEGSIFRTSTEHPRRLARVVPSRVVYLFWRGSKLEGASVLWLSVPEPISSEISIPFTNQR